MGRELAIAGMLLLLAVGMVWLIRPAPEAATIRALFHQTARWATAATQDENPAIRNLHANYAVGYMMALKDIAREDQIERVMGIPDVRVIFKQITDVQNAALLSLVSVCPEVAPKTPLARYGSQATL